MTRVWLYTSPDFQFLKSLICPLQSAVPALGSLLDWVYLDRVEYEVEGGLEGMNFGGSHVGAEVEKTEGTRSHKQMTSK